MTIYDLGIIFKKLLYLDIEIGNNKTMFKLFNLTCKAFNSE